MDDSLTRAAVATPVAILIALVMLQLVMWLLEEEETHDDDDGA